jgi:uncharacterized membrane protein YozB (DUF420 family)
MIFKRVGWVIMMLLVSLVLLVASRYLTLDPEVFFPEQRVVYTTHLTTLISHIVGSMIALALGPFLIINRIRTRWPAVHRWMGRCYLLGVLFGGMAGLLLANYAYGGWLNRVGFGLLAVSWLTTGLMAFIRIREGNIQDHRRWVIRNFALTLGAISLRLQTIFLGAIFDFDTAYAIVAWSAWVPNLIIAEWIIMHNWRASNQAIWPAVVQ